MIDSVASGVVSERGRLWIVFGLIGACVALYWPTSQSLGTLWLNVEKDVYLHGFVIAALSLWFVWRRREALCHVSAKPSPIAMVAIVAVSFVWLLSFQASVEIGHQLIYPLLMWLAVYAVLGRSAAMIMAIPLGYLYLAVPIWQVLIEPLQMGTTKVVYYMLRLAGIPTQSSGNIIDIPEGAFEVGDGCAGVNFILVAAAVAGLYGELLNDRLVRRIWLVLVAVVVGLLANWLRVFIIIVAGHLTNMEHYLVKTSHYGFGWFVFAVMVGLYLWLMKPVENGPEAPSSGPAASPEQKGSVAGLSATAVCLLIAPAIAFVVDHRDVPSPPATLLSSQGGGWSGPEISTSDWHPVYIGADAEQKGVYHSGASSVEAYRAVYVVQRQDKELINWGNGPGGKADAQVDERSTVQGGDGPYVELKLQDAGGHKWVIWYSYDIAGKSILSDTKAQFWYAVATLRANAPSSVRALRVECVPDCSAAQSLLRRFTASGTPSVS